MASKKKRARALPPKKAPKKRAKPQAKKARSPSRPGVRRERVTPGKSMVRHAPRAPSKQRRPAPAKPSPPQGFVSKRTRAIAEAAKERKRVAQNQRRADRRAWAKAGSRGDFERYRAGRQGWRTRATNVARVELGHKRRQILGYEDAQGRDIGRVPERYQLDGRKADQWHVLREMMRDEDPRWLEYLDAADDLDLDYDEAADGWFSPEV